jgi:hypothetical protein
MQHTGAEGNEKDEGDHYFPDGEVKLPVERKGDTHIAFGSDTKTHRPSYAAVFTPSSVFSVPVRTESR